MHPVAAKLFNDWVQRRRGWDYRPALAELERLQWEPPEVVEAWRLERLRGLLEHCAQNVPFYTEEFQRLGFEPAGVGGVEDLRSLPIVDKRTFRGGYERFLDSRGTRPGEDWVTSGATGEPFAFRLDRESIAANTFAGLARGRRWWDLDFGVPEAMIWSGVRDVSSTLQGIIASRRRKASWWLKNIRLIDIYNLDEKAVRRAYERLVRFQPRVFRVISSGLYRFCSVLDDLGLDGRALGVQAAIYTGEAFPAAQRRFVEGVLGCPTVCEYGCGELGIIAFECPEEGLHLVHENMYFEFLRDGEPARAGEPAELVVTNLNSHAAPLVRYSVGDVVVPSDERCPCGRSMPLIESVGGRSHDTIRTPAGGTIHGLFFTHLFDQLPEVHQFRIVQRALDRLRVEIVSSQPLADRARDFILQSIEKEMGGSAAVEVVRVEELPINRGGKTEWIVSELDADEAPPVSAPFRHIFLITDLEGVAGVSHWRQTREAGPDLEAARTLLTGEINAVVAGLLRRAQALGRPELEISVWDGHGTGGTHFDALDPRVEKYRHDDSRGFGGVLEAVRGAATPADAVGFIGQHAMEGTGGNLAHTYSSTRVKQHLLNGTPIGEFGTRALHAWALSVPTVFFSGDDIACREATDLVPGLVCVEVKRTRSVTQADSLTHDESCRRLGEAAERILDLRPDAPDLVPRFLPGAPFEYRQERRAKWGLVPRPTRVSRGDDLARVLRQV